MSLPSGPSPSPEAERASLIHREMVQVIVLGVIAVAGFFLTRAVALSNRRLAIQDAAEWFRANGYVKGLKTPNEP